MKHFLCTNLVTQEKHFATAEDDQEFPSGYDTELYSFQLLSKAPKEVDSAKAAFVTPADAEAWALEKIEEEIEKANGDIVRRLRRQIAIDRLWQEVQRLKLHTATNTVPATTLEKAMHFPTLMALVELTGNTLGQVATATENRLWDRVREAARLEAKLLVGHDNVRAATTIDEKVVVAQTILPVIIEPYVVLKGKTSMVADASIYPHVMASTLDVTSFLVADATIEPASEEPPE
jgi:hypothetical protein